MAIASTARTRAAYIAETVPGVTPATPTFKEFRRTSGNLRTKKTTVQSDQITLEKWRHRSTVVRVKERLARLWQYWL